MEAYTTLSKLALKIYKLAIFSGSLEYLVETYTSPCVGLTIGSQVYDFSHGARAMAVLSFVGVPVQAQNLNTDVGVFVGAVKGSNKVLLEL